MHTNAHRCPQNYWYLCFYTVFQGFIFTIDIHVNELSQVCIDQNTVVAVLYLLCKALPLSNRDNGSSLSHKKRQTTPKNTKILERGI